MSKKSDSKPLTRNAARTTWVDTWERPISNKRQEEIDELIRAALRDGHRDIRVRLDPQEIDGVRFWYTEHGFTCSPLRYSGLSISGWADDTGDLNVSEDERDV